MENYDITKSKCILLKDDQSRIENNVFINHRNGIAFSSIHCSIRSNILLGLKDIFTIESKSWVYGKSKMKFRTIALMSIVIMLVTITVSFVSSFTNLSFGKSVIESNSESTQRFNFISEYSEEKIVNKSKFMVASEFEKTGGTVNINNSQLRITINNLK